jgi:hypothetical protein
MEEATCRYRKCQRTFLYDETVSGRPPDFCCPAHRQAECRARHREGPPPIQRASNLPAYPLWSYYKRHKLPANEEAPQACQTCGWTWSTRSEIAFECPCRPVYTAENKPPFLVERHVLRARGFLPMQGRPLPLPFAYLYRPGQDWLTCLYDLRKIALAVSEEGGERDFEEGEGPEDIYVISIRICY